MIIGYARVSKGEQDLTLQINALEKSHCEKIFTDEITGVARVKPGLENAISHLRSGDTLVVWKLDRLGRNIKSLIEFTKILENKGVNFTSLTEGIDTSTTAGRFFFNIMASLADMERELIIERTRAGLTAARAKGKLGGRKRVMTAQKISSAKSLLKNGASPKEVASSLGVSVPTLYRWVPASSFESIEKPYRN